MPLQAEEKTLGAGHRDRFDGAIRRDGVGVEWRCEAIDALRVQRIDVEGFPPDHLRQQPAFCHANLVRRAVLNIKIGVLVLAMIESACNLLHVLMQGATEGDIQFLKAPAKAQDR